MPETAHRYYMHVNYLEQVFPLEEICARCAEAGYDGIELRDRDRFGDTPLERYLERAYAAAKAHDLDVVFGCRLNTTSEDASVRAEALTHCRTVIEFAGERGLTLLNAFGGDIIPSDWRTGQFDQSGSNIANDQHWQWTVEMLAEAGRFAQTRNITLCLEMHNNYIHDLADPTARLLERIGSSHVRANFDVGNVFLHPDQQGLDKQLHRIREYLGYVHLKNLMSFRRFDSRMFRHTPLRDGDINLYLLLRNLLQDYQGPLTIENTLRGDKRHLLHEDLAYLQSVVRDIDRERAS